MFFILNREFGYELDEEGKAADPLAGGILQDGYQCGMVWGSALAAGAQAYRTADNKSQATGLAIKASGKLLDSFEQCAGSADCRTITDVDFHNKLSFAKYMLTGRFLGCFNLMENWVPDAIDTAYNSLESNPEELPADTVSCASETVAKMGGNHEETMLVSGFAGGVGLSGNACGALGAAIWKTNLEWCQDNPGKSNMLNPEAKKILNSFLENTGNKYRCDEITGKKFEIIEEHSAYIKAGGCADLIEILSKA